MWKSRASHLSGDICRSPSTAQVILLFLVAANAVNNRGGEGRKEGRKEEGLLLSFHSIFLR